MGQPEYYLTSNAADKDGGGMNSQPGDLHNLEQRPILHFLSVEPERQYHSKSVKRYCEPFGYQVCEF